MTPAELAGKLASYAEKSSGLTDGVWSTMSAHVRRIRNTPDVNVAATVILIRADLCRKAEVLEARAAELRAWAREIGEDS